MRPDTKRDGPPAAKSRPEVPPPGVTVCRISDRDTTRLRRTTSETRLEVIMTRRELRHLDARLHGLERRRDAELRTRTGGPRS